MSWQAPENALHPYRLYQAGYVDNGNADNIIDKNDDDMAAANDAPASHYDVVDVGAKPEARAQQNIHDDNWNERFQAANELSSSSEIKNLELNRVCADFVSTARTYAECIIREHIIPSQMRALSTANVGGLAGGVKFKLRGILFKLCEDKNVGGGYIYGGQTHDYELAAKAAGHELRSTCIAFHACQARPPDSLPLTTTMMCLVDFLGWRLTAMPTLPLGDNSLRYGSDDGGDSFQVDPQFHSQIGKLADNLHLAPHNVRTVMGHEAIELYTAGDVEAHQGSDNRAYLLDLARLFPPEAPAAKLPSRYHLPNRGQSIFYRLLRPELLSRLKIAGYPPLSGDTWSLWSSESDSEAHEANVLAATQYLLQEVIPEFAKKVDETPSLLKNSLSAALHRHGINVRHLGLLRSLVQQEEVKTILLTEILARTLKQLLRKLLRESSMTNASDTTLRVDVAQFFNALSFQPQVWAKVKTELVLRFGSISLLHQERTADKFRLAGERVLSQVFKKLFVMTGITLVNTEVDTIGIGFQFAPEDFVLGMRVKHFDVMDWTSGSLLFEQASSRSYLPHSSRLRLYQLSARKFAACAATSTKNVEAEVRSVLAAIRVTADPKEADRILLESIEAFDWSPDSKQQLLDETGKLWTQRPPTFPDAWKFFRDHCHLPGLANVRIDIFNEKSNLARLISKDDMPQLLNLARWDCVGKNGSTVFHTACIFAAVEAVRSHLAQGANPNVQTPSGDTPLHFCFRGNNLELVRILLEAGADLNISNAWGCTPPQMAPLQFPFEKLEIKCPSLWSSRESFIRLTSKTIFFGILTFGALCAATFLFWFSELTTSNTSSEISYWTATGLAWAVLSVFEFLFRRFWYSLPFPCNDRAKLLRTQFRQVHLILLVLGAMVMPPHDYILRTTGFGSIMLCTCYRNAWWLTLFGGIVIVTLFFVELHFQFSSWSAAVSIFCLVDLFFWALTWGLLQEMSFQHVMRCFVFCAGYGLICAGSASTSVTSTSISFFALLGFSHMLLRISRFYARWGSLGDVLVEPTVWKQEQKVEQLDQGRARLRELVSEWQTRALTPSDWILFKRWKHLPELEHVQLDIFSVSDYELSIFDLFPQDHKEMLLRAKPGIKTLEGRTPLAVAIELQLDDVAESLKERYPEQLRVKDIYGYHEDNYCDSQHTGKQNVKWTIVDFSWGSLLFIICLVTMNSHTAETRPLATLLIHLGSQFLGTRPFLQGAVVIFPFLTVFAWFVYLRSLPDEHYALYAASICAAHFFFVWKWLWKITEVDWVQSFDLTLPLQRRDCVLFALLSISVAEFVALLGLVVQKRFSVISNQYYLWVPALSTLGIMIFHILWWLWQVPSATFQPWRSQTNKGPIQIWRREEFIYLVKCRADYMSKLHHLWQGSSQAETALLLAAIQRLAQRQLIERYPHCIHFASPGLLNILKLNQSFDHGPSHHSSMTSN